MNELEVDIVVGADVPFQATFSICTQMQRIRPFFSQKRRPFHMTEGTEIINIVLAPPVTAYPLV